MEQKSSGLVPLCQLISGWLFYENGRISQRVSSTLSSPSMTSGSLINPNQIALSMSCSIRSKILWMVSSERYEVILMRQDGVRQPWGFYQPTNWKHPHLRLPLRAFRNRRRMQPSRSERHPQRMWKCKWIYPCLKHTPDPPRMGKICASSRIGFRLQKIQPRLWQLHDWI